MKKALCTLMASWVACLIVGCDPAPSTPLAPEVKKPDFSKMSGKELLEYKKKNDSGMNR